MLAPGTEPGHPQSSTEQVLNKYLLSEYIKEEMNRWISSQLCCKNSYMLTSSKHIFIDNYIYEPLYMMPFI